MPVRLVAAAVALVLGLAVAVALAWDRSGTDGGSRSTASPSATADPSTAASAAPARSTPAAPPSAAAAPTAPSPAMSPEPSAAPSPGLPPAGVDEDEVVVRYRVEVRTADRATRGAADVVERTLSDPRGWSRAGFRLVRDDHPSSPFVVVLAEADEVDRLCRPYDTYGRYSCQNGPVVALNADRWRGATPEWTGDLATYRQMLVNHEVGHLLGMRHPPAPQCPEAGRPALVMSQQSTELDGCRPNPWPLEKEVERAARHDLPLAPPYDR